MTPAVKVDAGCYVYALVRDDGRPLPERTGLGGARLRLVRSARSEVAAVVSDASALPGRVRRADLLAHSDVLQALVADRDVVPIRFGSVYGSDEEMCDGLLAARAGELRRLLAAVEGRVEVQVRITYDEAIITAELVASDRHLRKMRDRARSSPGDQGAQIELGRRFAAALEARRAGDTRDLAGRLGRVAEAVDVTAASGDFAVAKVACLMSRRRLDRLDDLLDRLATEGSGRYQVEVLGPLPPYSFVGDGLAEVG